MRNCYGYIYDVFEVLLNFNISENFWVICLMSFFIIRLIIIIYLIIEIII